MPPKNQNDKAREIIAANRREDLRRAKADLAGINTRKKALNPMDFPCPACGAKPGQGCRAINDEAMSVPHLKRQETVLEGNPEHESENIDKKGVKGEQSPSGNNAWR
jgi:hypothetical protein